MEKNFKQQQSDIIKIALFGPESTGKTTLAEQLAKTFNTNWIPEFARNYLQQKWDAKKEACTYEDLIPIAIGQIKLENEGLEQANTYLFCDTNIMVTKIFSEMQYQKCDEAIEKAAKKHKYDLVFLTDIDVPWEKDDLRDSPNSREKAVAIFENKLIQYNKPYIKLSGNKTDRLQKATEIINQLKIAKNLGFNSFDFISMYNKGISLATIAKQFEFLNKGIPTLNLDRPATLHDGISSLTTDEAKYHAAYFDEKKITLKLKKFVPASGAASRMFKFLLEFIAGFDPENESINAYINKNKEKNLALFIFAKDKFPFHEALVNTLQTNYPNFDQLSADQKEVAYIKTMLLHPDFDFSNKPKGILPFHKYPNHVATPIEEHLQECIAYATSNGKSNLHFTVSEEHVSGFQKTVNPLIQQLQIEKGVEINVTYSFQNPATDVVAMDHHNKPFREKDESIVFRPGGHGALIENLNKLNSDLVFIKNIDNVIQSKINEIALYKKALAGILLQHQETIFKYLKYLEGAQVSNEMLHEIENFASQKLNCSISEGFANFTKNSKIDFLFALLNKPIRVCGMVKNEGEPGGGPFWVKNPNGTLTLQIIEASQIAENQIIMTQKATHFNPVDLVCGLKNYQGQTFDLLNFVDENTGFIVEKNKHGKKVKAYELPGLWNGAMAHWISIFVEVPLLTFSPVKTVNDLLKPTHQLANG